MRIRLVLGFIFLSSFLFISNGFALETSYGTAGCGLGSMLFGSQPGPIQVIAATFNGTLGNQTFGITTGTSNCGKGIVNVSEDKNLINFVQSNFDNLAKEMAIGNGESLSTLAELTRVPAEKRPAFYSTLQKNFASIFSSENVQVSEVVNHIFLFANY